MVRWLVLPVFALTLLGATGQNGYYPAGGARGVGMGNAGLGFQDINSAFSNPSGLAFLDGFSAAATVENRFLLKELHTAMAAAALPAAGGTFGMTLRYFGFELYNELQTGLSYARKLSDGFAIGAQFHYLQTRISEYGGRGIFTFEISFQALILSQLTLGGRLYNPMRIEIIDGEFAPTIFALGLSYQPAAQLTLVLETEKDIDFPVRIKGAVEYTPVSAFSLRLGAAAKPTSISFGMGLWIKERISLDIASGYHQFLGFSPAFGIVYRRL